MTEIHATAIIDPKAEIDEGVKVGPYAIIEGDVVIRKGCEIGPHVFIAAGTRLGENCKISQGAVLGTLPQDLKFSGEKTYLEIGNNTTIREYATLNRGTTYHYKTVVGDNCLLMAYSHIAHDCIIGNNVVIANAVNMAGHVVIEDYVGIGGMTPIHQFVRIGEHSFIGGGYRVPKDVPPYILAMGEPLRYGGLNVVGLKRRGFQSETMQFIKKAYRILFRSNITVSAALDRIEAELPQIPEIKHIVEFVRQSERGIIR